MDRISAGRALMGDSLGFHLLIIIFGVGLPVLISLLELYGLVRHKPRAQKIAKVWSKALAILFIAGAVSGTIISLQFDLIWPTFMAFISKTIGLAFVLEGTMFMIEAVFLSVYILSWNRITGWWHWLIGLVVVLGSTGSAIFITTANAFMNKPAGFNLDSHGNPINIKVTQAIFTRTSFVEIVHSLPAYLCATVLVLLAIYAWLYHKPQHKTDRPWMGKLIAGLAGLALVCALALGVTGDLSARYLAKEEPYKLAAAEALYQTQSHAPLIVGGVVRNEKIDYGLRLPSMLSFLATHDFAGQVQGLDKTNATDRPSIAVHYFFDGMTAIAGIIVLLPLVFLVLYKTRRKLAFSNTMLYGLVACGFLGMVANEFGWLVTELGRQPYIIHGVMRVGDALTTSEAVIRFGFIFPTLFILLIGLTIWVLRRVMNNQEARI